PDAYAREVSDARPLHAIRRTLEDRSICFRLIFIAQFQKFISPTSREMIVIELCTVSAIVPDKGSRAHSLSLLWSPPQRSRGVRKRTAVRGNSCNRNSLRGK